MVIHVTIRKHAPSIRFVSFTSKSWNSLVSHQKVARINYPNFLGVQNLALLSITLIFLGKLVRWYPSIMMEWFMFKWDMYLSKRYQKVSPSSKILTSLCKLDN
jgi:hypothetical protein